MLVTFKTEAYESLTFFGHIAQRLLTMMGQSGRIPGAILAEDVAQALALLSKAVESEQQQPQLPAEQEKRDTESDISLKHRALPLLALLQAAVDKHCDVLWE
ncbi:MAG: DUF1840 family protein [Legionellales bacterium]|nr:DUF1840 family protein [Legionellales bacterium]